MACMRDVLYILRNVTNPLSWLLSQNLSHFHPKEISSNYFIRHSQWKPKAWWTFLWFVMHTFTLSLARSYALVSANTMLLMYVLYILRACGGLEFFLSPCQDYVVLPRRECDLLGVCFVGIPKFCWKTKRFVHDSKERKVSSGPRQFLTFVA